LFVRGNTYHSSTDSCRNPGIPEDSGRILGIPAGFQQEWGRNKSCCSDSITLVMFLDTKTSAFPYLGYILHFYFSQEQNSPDEIVAICILQNQGI
jgi:hypothetical protein